MTQYKIGIVGLGVMGQNLALNIADNGFPAAGFDLDSGKSQAAAAKFAGQQMNSRQFPGGSGGVARNAAPLPDHGTRRASRWIP